MYNNQKLEPQRHPSPAGGFLQTILGVLVLFLSIVGLIVGFHTFLQAAPILVQMLIVIVLVAVPVSLISQGAKNAFAAFHQLKQMHLATQRREVELEQARIDAQKAAEELEAMRDARRRENEAHQLHLAESQIPADAAGNYAAIYNRQTGQVIMLQPGQYIQPVPTHWAPHIHYDYKDTSTRVSEEQQAHQLTAAPVAAPSIDSIIARLPYNELMTAYGATLTTGKLITASIPEAVHFKLVGGSGFGKSCEAAALLKIATLCNDPGHLQIALLDLEHKTSRLFEHLPHVTTIRMGRRSVDMAMNGPSADEVAFKLNALVYELQRRAARNIETPVLLIYVEELLSLQYEVDDSLLSAMLDNLAILAVRGRKYGMFLEACTQADYSTQQLKVAQKQFRSRIAFAIDPTAARASGFTNTELIKQNFQTGQPGQFVLEKPGFSELMVAPLLDVKQELRRLEVGTSTLRHPTSSPAEVGTKTTSNAPHVRVVESDGSTGGKRAEVANEEGDLSRSDETQRAKEQAVEDLLKQRKGQNEIIAQVWGVTGGRAYQLALGEYRAIVARIIERREQA